MADKNTQPKSNAKNGNKGEGISQERIEQKIRLVKENPNSIVYPFKTKIRDRILRPVRNIDFADVVIREEWGYGLTGEEVADWNKTFKDLAEKAKDIVDQAITLGEDFVDFNIENYKKMRRQDKINLISDSRIPTDVLVANATPTGDLFEALIIIDVYDLPIKQNCSIDEVEEKWFKPLKEFENAVLETKNKAFNLIIKAKTDKQGRVSVGDIKFSSLKKEIRGLVDSKQSK